MSMVAVKAGAKKRRSVRRSESEWRALVESQRRSGLTQAAFCAEAGISPMSLLNWRKRLQADAELRSIGATPTFIELARPTSVESGPMSLRLELGQGIVLTITCSQ